jgi:hypothetical protein
MSVDVYVPSALRDIVPGKGLSIVCYSMFGNAQIECPGILSDC